jgi:hypothetical protein
MSEPLEPIESIEQAIEEIAKGMVASSSEHGRTVQRLPIKDLIEAANYLAAQKAAKNPTFGLRRTRMIPPGGGG